MTQAVAGKRTESNFETTIERGPDAIKEQFPPPGIAPDWQAAKAAQFRYTQLQRRAQVLIPAAILFLVGLCIGDAPLPFVLKAVLAASAIVLIAQAVVATRSQKRAMDEVYDLVKPDKIRVTNRSE